MKAEKKTGRPSGGHSRKLNEATITGICKCVSVGMSFKASAAAVGVGESTFHYWMRKAQAGRKGLHLDLLQRIEIAQEAVKFRSLAKIQKLIAGGPAVKITVKKDATGKIIGSIEETSEVAPNLNACCWLLERRFPSEFGKQITIEHGVNPFQVSMLGALQLGSGNPGEEDPNFD